MKKHLIDFPENNISIESFYERLRPCYDSIMQDVYKRQLLHGWMDSQMKSSSTPARSWQENASGFSMSQTVQRCTAKSNLAATTGRQPRMRFWKR